MAAGLRPAPAEAPPIGLLMREGAALGGLFRRAPDCEVVRRHRNGARRPVLVIPGFLAGDRMTARLRATLRSAGYHPFGWGLGLNRGITPGLLDRIARRIETVRARSGCAVAVVGWSLGGLYAREVAKCRPDLVERVVTLGTPFSADIHANRAWRLYELVNDHPVDHPPVTVDLHAKPPVPTVAVWSPRDGIVSGPSARGACGEADARICVASTHIGLVSAPAALDAVLDALERRL